MIAGKSLIQRVIEQCRRAASLAEVIVATDDERIAEVAGRLCRVEMTRSDHPSGTDRIAEAAARLDADALVNIQGDEPLMAPLVIERVAAALADAPMSTAATPLTRVEDYADPNIVKVVTSASGRALYFSRRTIPYLRDEPDRSPARQVGAYPFLKHLGIYGYRRSTLLELVRLPVAELERAERLEQLRALANDIPITVARVDHEAVGVDVPSDVAKVETLLREREEESNG